MGRRSWWASWVPLVAILAFSAGLHAEESEGERLLKLKADKHARASERYDVPGPKSAQGINFGGGRIMVNAPLPVVRQVVSEYRQYSEFLPRFEKSLILDKNAQEGSTDVFLEVSVAKGLYKLTAVTRFLPVKRAGAQEWIEGAKTGEKGNLKDLRAIWRMYPYGENRTVLKLELLIVPDLPSILVPTGTVNDEAQYAADEAVTAAGRRAEQRYEKQQKSAAPGDDSED